MNILLRKLLCLTLFSTLLFTSCQPDSTTETTTDFNVVVRHDSEPDRLNPMLTSSGYANDILGNIFLPLMDYDPFTVSFVPALATAPPEVNDIVDGPFAGGKSFTFEILPEAMWDEEHPITGKDYEFTLKAVFNPLVEASRWRGYLQFIKDVQIDPDNPKKFTVLTYPNYMNVLFITSNFPIYPAHIYDPENTMGDVSFADLADPEKAQTLAQENPNLQTFASAFDEPKYSRDTAFIVGAGPYKLKRWESGQRVVLEKKSDWWGDQLSDSRPYLIARPKQIIYEAIPDVSATKAKLKSLEIDAIGAFPPQDFKELEGNDFVSQNFDFFTQTVAQYYYIPMNTKSPLLNDKRVRRAMAHTLDMEAAKQDILLGMGEPITGPFVPFREYYNDTLTPHTYNLDRARSLLAEAGWADSDGNGILDKVINGAKTELAVRFFVSKGPLGQQLAILMKSNASKAGIDVQIIEKDFRVLLTEHVAQKDYDLTVMLGRQGPVIDDPFQNWHTDSDRPDGGNYTGFGTARSDTLITAIRTEPDREKRNNMFRELQEIIYEEQPAIFLFAKKEGIIISNKFDAASSPLRPGFFPRYFKLKSAQ